MVFNVRPRQLQIIPWGWKNEQTPWGPVCVEPRGEISMPVLTRHFSWDEFNLQAISGYGDLEHHGAIITRDMKSVFNTAARFLGWSALLTQTPSLRPITEGFLAWNKKLLCSCPVPIDYFVIGDDFASTQGLMISPDLWRSWIKPELALLLDLASVYSIPAILHTDGDITQILDDIAEMGFYALHPCMEVPALADLKEYKGMKLLHAFPDFSLHDYTPT